MTGYADVALLYRERGFEPIPAHKKKPVPAGATGRNGTVTDDKIQDWIANGFRYMDHETGQWRTQDAQTANTALRAGELEVRIDVDDYGPKEGARQLAELEAKLGPLPATPSSTSRGMSSPSRQYFFLLHEPVILAGKAADDIDVIQSGHRYSIVHPSRNPDAGDAPYVWYDADGEPMAEPPHLEDLEYLPQAWIDYLAVDERDFGQSGEQWDGEMPESASEAEQHKLRVIVGSLQSLPDVWQPGSGWHDVTRDAACWLQRMVNSNAYALTEPQALHLLIDNTPVDDAQGGLKGLIAQWESCKKLTAGQFEPPPHPPLLPWSGFPTDRAFPTVNGEPFVGLWGRAPEDTSSGSMWARRKLLFVALLQSGVSDQEAVTIVWHSAAAQNPDFMIGGVALGPEAHVVSLSDLWRELEAARETKAAETGESAEAAPLDERPNLAAPDRLAFLTNEERAIVNGPDGAWWGRTFIDWAYATFSHTNEPYYRMNRWTILSVIFGPKAMLPRPGGNDRPLNIYQAIVGTTTSGKTEALRPAKHVFKAYFLLDENPDIGGNHTPESLTETLVSKDGKATWFHVDEAHTKIAIWKKPVGPYTEMPGVITDVFDGDVGAIYRASKKGDPNMGRGARACMVSHLMGTPRGMADVMGPDDWESGFMNRFVWAIGDLPIDSFESVAGDWIDEDSLEEDETADTTAGHRIYQQWAAEFSNAVSKVSKPSGMPARMRLPKAVIERHRQFAWALSQIAHQRPVYAERLRPTFRRLGETVLRCAALVALSKGRIDVTMTDLLIALEQAEEWATNILIMVEATDETLRTREVNAIEKALIESGGVMTLASIHRVPRFRNRRREVEDLIGELIAQGRVEKDKAGGVDTVRVKGILDERSAA